MCRIVSHIQGAVAVEVRGVVIGFIEKLVVFAHDHEHHGRDAGRVNLLIPCQPSFDKPRFLTWKTAMMVWLLLKLSKVYEACAPWENPSTTTSEFTKLALAETV